MKEAAAEADDWAPIIDCHAHVFLRDLPLAAGATHRPERSFTTEDYVRLLDEQRVPFGVIAAPSFLGSYNDYMFEALRCQPRLRGTAIVEPGIGPYELQAMDDDGIRGIRFSLRRYPTVPDLTSPEYRRLLRRIRDLDWHVHIFAENHRLADLIPQLVESGVNLVVDHFGNPSHRDGFDCPGFQAVLRAVAAGRTWVKLSAPYRLEAGWDPQVLVDRLLAEAGPERLLWASDCPWTAHEREVDFAATVDWFKAWVPDRRLRERIGMTGLRLYRFI